MHRRRGKTFGKPITYFTGCGGQQDDRQVTYCLGLAVLNYALSSSGLFFYAHALNITSEIILPREINLNI